MAEPLREKALYFPSSLVDVLLREAARLDRSVSWCLQQAWKLARDRIEIDADDASDGEERRKRTIHLPEPMLREIQEVAARYDRSLSFVVCRAWQIAAPEILALPSDRTAT